MPLTDDSRAAFRAMIDAHEAKCAAILDLLGDGRRAIAFVAGRDADGRVLGIRLFSRDSYEPGAYRLTHFTEDGPCGHMTFGTLREVAASLLAAPIDLAPEQLDAWSQTARWARGLAAEAETRLVIRRPPQAA